MYRDRFGTNWERLSVDEAIRRAFALGAASELGEGVDGERERLQGVAETPADRRMLDLAFDEGRARARGRRGADESTWAAVVSGDHEFATALDPPRHERGARVPRGVPEAVGKFPLLDEPGDGLEKHRLPGLLGRRSKRDGDED
ncbi:hypothetical protein N0B31_09765 [Salinirubellus salinus]|jgi:hypothetical protein|uniref:Uncharacterized protein n=1 Tax=Salinirubellus salinus TaxID=1364945 RepID=A0A9E7R6V5_9EURY|nr:hypothetical protein [Salinirubellus salinus]UWM56561.1 hypothetical protein N0B31_09765 [Salinirubellus salinus]